MTSQAAAGDSARPRQQPAAVSARRWLVLQIVCVGELMCVLDTTIVNIALPSIQRDLHMSLSGLQWVVNADILLFGGFLLLGGRLADLLGRKRLFLAGLVIFTLASLTSGLAHSTGVLVVGRGGQGLGAALLTPAALSIVTTTFEDGRERARALSIWGSVTAGAAALGLVLGGVLTQALTWHWIFFINVPIGVVTFAAALPAVPGSPGKAGRRRFDIAGAVLVTSGLILGVYALVEGQSQGWASAQTIVPGAIAVVLLAAFLVNELRVPEPLMRLSLLRVRTLAVANSAQFLNMAGVMGMFYFTTLYVQDILGFDPFVTGLLFLPATLAVIVGANIARRLIQRIGPVALGTAGLVVSALGMLYFTRIPVHGSYLADVLPGMLPRSIGLGMTYVPLILLATAVPPQDAGLASGLLSTIGQVGGAIGLAVLSTLAAIRTAHVLAGHPGAGTALVHAAQVSGFRLAFTCAAGSIVCGAILYAALLRRRNLPPSAGGPPAPDAAGREPTAAAGRGRADG
ncbi:MAG TPA: MFS transporter [Streptosporangiaceae bacterium]|jgi:EmrB/QacA subfamily drug resistance transporter